MQQRNALRAAVVESIFVLVLIALDQFVKELVLDRLVPLGSSLPLWDGVFHLTSVHNTGAAFGMFAGSYWPLVAIRIVISAAMVFFLIRYHGRLTLALRVSLLAILAGAIGNVIDQVMFGYVRDMFEFRFINFAVFNVADSYITMGVVFLASYLLLTDGKAFDRG